MQEITAKIEKMSKSAKYMDKRYIAVWAQQILDKKYDDYETAPENLELPHSKDELDIEIDPIESKSAELSEESQEESGEDYGDVVTVKNQQFVVCSGLVVPQQMLKDTIIPMINQKMKDLGIDVDDVYSALMDDEK